MNETRSVANITRAHVLKDLRPYMCVHERCKEQPDLYESAEMWVSHMQLDHGTQYVCSAGHHGSLTFSDRHALEVHIRSEHRESVTESQIPIIVTNSRRPANPIICLCPFCGGLPEELDESVRGRGLFQPVSLQAHIAEHLKALSLFVMVAKSNDGLDSDRSWSAGAGDWIRHDSRSTHSSYLSFHTLESRSDTKKDQEDSEIHEDLEDVGDVRDRTSDLTPGPLPGPFIQQEEEQAKKRPRLDTDVLPPHPGPHTTDTIQIYDDHPPDLEKAKYVIHPAYH